MCRRRRRITTSYGMQSYSRLRIISNDIYILCKISPSARIQN